MTTASFLDSNPEPASLASISGSEFEALKQNAFKRLSLADQRKLAGSLLDIETNLDYAARYLALIGEIGEFTSDNPQVWLQAYNVSKSNWGTIGNYGNGFMGWEKLSWTQRIWFSIIDFFDLYADGWD